MLWKYTYSNSYRLFLYLLKFFLSFSVLRVSGICISSSQDWSLKLTLEFLSTSWVNNVKYYELNNIYLYRGVMFLGAFVCLWS